MEAYQFDRRRNKDKLWKHTPFIWESFVDEDEWKGDNPQR